MARRGEKSGGTNSGTAVETSGGSSASGGGTAVQERPQGGRAARRRGFGPTALGGMGLTRPGIPPSPWELMGRMSEELTQLFDSIGGAGTAASRAQPGITSRRSRGTEAAATAAPVLLIPNIEVLQRPGALVVRADLPGLDANEIDVSVDNGMLVISGERTQEQQDESDGFVRSEVLYGAFYRAIPLPDGADENNIAATVSNGVLEVIVPVSERDASRRVQVRNAEGEKSGTAEGGRTRSAEGSRSGTAEGGRSGTNA
jgi:HSP20 family protein